MRTRFCQIQDSVRGQHSRPSRSYAETGPRTAQARPTGPSTDALDHGHSPPVNRFETESGERASVYAVCMRFWLLVCFGLAVVAAVTLVMGPIHSAVRVTSLLLWTLCGGALLMVALRHWTVTRPRGRYRETTNH